jgi:hypothetical protein
MQTTASPSRSSLIREIVQSHHDIDLQFPPWARRTHPIVRRHLGRYWRVMTPQVEPVMQWYLIQSAIVLLTYPVPFLFTIILPVVIVSVGLLPFAFYYYAQTLYALASDATQSMVREIEGSTLNLLLATPYTTREVLLSKLAGAMWRQSEPLSLLLSAISMTQMPTLVLIYLNQLPSEEYGILSQVVTIMAFGVAIARIPLEMAMTAAISSYVGVTTRGRSAAVITTLTLLIFYFVLINLPRMMPLGIVGHIIVDGVLPLAIPFGIISLMLTMTERAIRRLT